MTTGAMRVPRSRGALTGLLVLLLGAWGALIPFIGPYFTYGFTPDTVWTPTLGRWFLEVAPGALAFLAGLMLLGSKDRATGSFAGWLGSAAGIWFVLGPVFSLLWNPSWVGIPVGGTVRTVVEEIGFFPGLGVAILFFSALALGRYTVLGVRDVQAAEKATAARQARRNVASTERIPQR